MEGYQEPNLYEGTYGLPIVRKRIGYAQVLREIRQGKIKEVSYFDSNVAPSEDDKYRMKNITMEGYCIVMYQDQTVAQVRCSPALNLKGLHSINRYSAFKSKASSMWKKCWSAQTILASLHGSIFDNESGVAWQFGDKFPLICKFTQWRKKRGKRATRFYIKPTNIEHTKGIFDCHYQPLQPGRYCTYWLKSQIWMTRDLILPMPDQWLNLCMERICWISKMCL